MHTKVFPLTVILVLGLTSCNLPPSNPPRSSPPAATSTDQPGTSLVALPDEPSLFAAPPIVAVPKSTVQIAGDALDAYQAPGNRLRVVCQQPCPLDERLADALYAGYLVTIQNLVRTVGFDVLDKYKPIDVHITRDSSCVRSAGENGSSGHYPDDPNSIVICLYLTDPDITEEDPAFWRTPEAAIRLGGLGVFAHEYAHSLLFGRFRASLHDFVSPIEWNTLSPSDPYYGDLCDPVYESFAPFTHRLCLELGLTYPQLLQSLIDMNRLYEGGHGEMYGMVSFNQYLAILDDILGGGVRQVFVDVGYQSFFDDESTTPYRLPYADEPCSYRAQVLGGETTPLGTTLDVNAAFEKTWRVKNSGSCNWDGVQLVFVRGEAMTETTVVAVASTAAGAIVPVTVPLTAPGVEGVHAGVWRLRSPSGQDFGPVLNLMVFTRPGCSLPPQFSFLKADPPTVGPRALSLITWGQVTNVDDLELVGLGSADPDGDRLLVRPDRTTTYTLKASCGTNTVTTQVTLTVDTGLPPFAITDLTARADPADFEGACGEYGKHIDFAAGFASNGPGVVLYHWDRSDQAISDPKILVFEAAGTHAFNSSWTLGRSFRGWMELKILAPVESEAVRADFSLTCDP